MTDLEECHVNDLPDEVLEYILSLLRPYDDLRRCKLVCRRWNKSATRVLCHKKSNFSRCLANFNISWEHYTPSEKSQSISKRYSHSACSHGNSMYVFGGCTCTSTTFNDLWRLDLSTRKWFRLLTMGTYPTPKALATIVYYEGNLVLFGGWTHPTPFPLHQAWRTFNELHMYDIKANRWSCVLTPSFTPPPMAGHSASIHRDDMVVFGGICGWIPGSANGNDIWCFNFVTQSWRKQETSELRPIARYNQSQIALDDNHLLIIGGCGGRPSMLLSDVWLLTLQGNIWQWHQIEVTNPHWGMTHPSHGQLWCHPACKIGTNVVSIGRNSTSTLPSFSLPKWNLSQCHSQTSNEPVLKRRADGCEAPLVDRDVNVNGKRGSLTPRSSSRPQSEAGHSKEPAHPRVSQSERVRNMYPYNNRNLSVSNNSMAAFRAAPTTTGNKYRERQLEVLNRMEERLRNMSRNSGHDNSKEKPSPPPSSNLIRQPSPKMALFVMDIRNVLTEHCVRWLPFNSVASEGPDHTILYSLVSGQGEIIMFGGIIKDASLFCIEDDTVNVINTVTNSLHFITAPQTIV